MSRIIISICGGSGSGKSTVARQLAERLGPQAASRIPADFYLLPNMYPTLKEFFSLPLRYDWDLLDQALREEDGQEIQSPDFDFVSFLRRSLDGGRRFTLRPVMMIDGMLPYPRASCSVFLHAPEAERRARIIARDAVWGTRVIDYWDQHQRTLAEIEKGIHHFDLLLDGLAPVEENVERIANWLIGRCIM